MLFLKKGIDKAKDKNIYPHPSQTNTGNCGAYAGAACLYAFGLDHQSDLIPPANGGTDGEKFQYQISKMVERLTDLCYGSIFTSVVEGYRKYISEVGLNCKFDVTEEPLTVYEYDHIAGEYRWVTNLLHIFDELKRCQDIILFIQYGGALYDPFHDTHRHAVGLVGLDEGSGELIINNPWGSSIHVNPDDAAKNTTDGKTDNAFTRHKYTVDSDGYVHFPFDGYDAFIYDFIMICPVDDHAVSMNSQIRTLEMPQSHFPIPASMRSDEPVKRIEYAIMNRKINLVNGLAIELPSLNPENVISIGSPPGWKTSFWYREKELGFDYLAPETILDLTKRTFAGVIWRCEEGGIPEGGSLAGFHMDVLYPKSTTNTFDIKEKKSEEWYDSVHGHGIVLYERDRSTTAWHVSVTTPSKVDSKRRTIFNREKKNSSKSYQTKEK
jgi:hypothetical protein